MKIIDFMGQRKLALIFSTILLAVAIGSLATKQLNWGLEKSCLIQLTMTAQEKVMISNP